MVDYGEIKIPALDRATARDNMIELAGVCYWLREEDRKDRMPATLYNLTRKFVAMVLSDCRRHLSLEEMETINNDTTGVIEALK